MSEADATRMKLERELVDIRQQLDALQSPSTAEVLISQSHYPLFSLSCVCNSQLAHSCIVTLSQKPGNDARATLESVQALQVCIFLHLMISDASQLSANSGRRDPIT